MPVSVVRKRPDLSDPELSLHKGYYYMKAKER